MTAPLVTWLDRNATRVVVVLALVYVAIELVYLSRLPLVMDEFQGAWSVDRLRSELPYRDFRPYKTVLGYYLQLVPRSLPLDLWPRLLVVKATMAVLNGAAIVAGALWLIRRHRPAAVCLSTLALVCMSTFLERSTELRVDMLTAWCGCFGLLLLLDGRAFLAGVLAATSFLVSQKGAYYIGCSLAALAVVAWGNRAGRSEWWLGARLLLTHLAGLLAPIAIYVAAWGAVSSFGEVIGATFFAHGHIALTDMYDNLGKYWRDTLKANPFFWAIAAAAVGTAWFRRSSEDFGRRQLLVFVYGGLLGILGALHKQPWPYFFVILIPTAWVLGTFFFETALEKPLARPRAALAFYVVLAVLLPLAQMPRVFLRDNGFQRQSVNLAQAILEPGDTYLAGVELVPTHRQTMQDLSWLDRRRKKRLATLDLERMVRELDQTPPKLLVWSDRLEKLPARLDDWLRSTFTPFSSNVWLYAPTIQADEPRLTLRFTGFYRILAPTDVTVTIDGRTAKGGQRLALSAGAHTVDAPRGVRLQLTPEVPAHLLDPRWAAPRPFFNRVYDY